METLVKAGWRVIREWRNRFGNHWILLMPDGRIWSGVDNVKNKSKAWRRLLPTVPPVCGPKCCDETQEQKANSATYTPRASIFPLWGLPADAENLADWSMMANHIDEMGMGFTLGDVPPFALEDLRAELDAANKRAEQVEAKLKIAVGALNHLYNSVTDIVSMDKFLLMTFDALDAIKGEEAK